MEPVSERFHARLWAEGKCYSYRIGTDEQKSVFDRKFRYHLGEALDVEAMRRAAQDLVGTHDFKTVLWQSEDEEIYGADDYGYSD